MAWSLIASVGAQSTNSAGFTSAAINTSGADLIVIHMANIGTATLSDSQSNSYTSLAVQASAPRSVLFYKLSPSTSASHTFTLSGSSTFGSLEVEAWSGAGSFDKETGSAVVNAVTGAPGSATPTNASSLIITGVSGLPNTASVDSSFTISHQFSTVGGTAYGGGMAYLTQAGGPSAVNPTWSWSSTTNGGVTLAVFAPTGGGGGGGLPHQNAFIGQAVKRSIYW